MAGCRGAHLLLDALDGDVGLVYMAAHTVHLRRHSPEVALLHQLHRLAHALELTADEVGVVRVCALEVGDGLAGGLQRGRVLRLEVCVLLRQLRQLPAQKQCALLSCPNACTSWYDSSRVPLSSRACGVHGDSCTGCECVVVEKPIIQGGLNC